MGPANKTEATPTPPPTPFPYLILEWFGLEGTLKMISFLSKGRDVFH